MPLNAKGVTTLIAMSRRFSQRLFNYRRYSDLDKEGYLRHYVRRFNQGLIQRAASLAK